MAKILVIDDDQSIRTFLDRLLSRNGYDVILADNGQKGLELFRRERPHAILLDLIMPEMNGIAVLQQIRSVDEKIPVIVLTGTRIPEIKPQAYAVGVTEFVEKEFSIHVLLEALNRHLKTSARSIFEE
jgi:DNA-binding NtrC family response regulator